MKWAEVPGPARCTSGPELGADDGAMFIHLGLVVEAQLLLRHGAMRSSFLQNWPGR